MIVSSILNQVQTVVQRGLRALSAAISRLTKPLPTFPAAGTLADLARNKSQLIAENMVLRQQLIVLNRSVKRPYFTQADRVFFVLLANRLQTWKDVLLIVKPETVLRWHRQGFRLFWKRKSRATSQQPKIPAETVILIMEMATNNRL